MTNRDPSAATLASSYWKRNSVTWEAGAYPEDSSLSSKASWLDSLSSTFRGNAVRERMNRALAILAPVVSGKRFNDVGCASGRFAFYLIQRGASGVVGVDVSDDAIALANENLARSQPQPSIRFMRFDIFGGGVMPEGDIGTALGLAEYFPPEVIPQLLASMNCRHFFVHAPPEPKLNLRRVLRGMYLAAKSGPRVYYHELQTFAQAARQLGLEPVRYVGAGGEFITNIPASALAGADVA